jgi:hypothetical protein
MNAVLPAAMAAQMAATQQNAALSMLKQSAGAERQVASMLEETLLDSPAPKTRGAVVDIKA